MILKRFAVMTLAWVMLFCRTGNAEMYKYSVPELINDGWETADLRTANYDVALIEALVGRIRNGTYKSIHSVVLIKNGKLIIDEYFSGREEDGQDRVYRRDVRHGIHSATKSVNSILIGIAIDQKLIAGVDEKVSTFFPEYQRIFESKEKEKDTICLKHLLSMTAGLSWDESTLPYTDTRNDHVAMNRSEDPIRYVLERPLIAAPGSKFIYSSGISIVLGDKATSLL